MIEYFRDYIDNIIKSSDNSVMNLIKIVTIKNKIDPFIINSSNSVLNSQTLFNLTDLHELKDDDVKHILTEYNIDKLRQYILNSSNLLKENMLFYEFDLYSNFLLSNKSTNKDIMALSNKIKINYNKNFDTHHYKNFVNCINPYKIEKVVFSGGGSKGMIYLGTFLGLLLSGNLFYINSFIGTSIGALTATLLALVTPKKQVYQEIKEMNLHNILKNTILIDKYKKSINFIIERFVSRPIDSFYQYPKYTLSSIYDTVKKMIYDNYLYDFEKSGFGIWFALICKHICKIMDNDLDILILVRDNNNALIDIDLVDFNDDFTGWKIERFFTFEEYNKITGKSIVLTGTKWDPIETVYYTETDVNYKDMTILKACNASSCIPGIFRPVTINGTHNLDGGLFDNFPLTYSDKKVNNRIMEYNNRVIGFMIDDQNSTVEPYEIIREIWLLYNGFIDSAIISYLMDSDKYVYMTELFFEIRLELFKLLYGANTEIKNFIHGDSEISLSKLELIIEEINMHTQTENKLFKCFKINTFSIESIKNILLNLEYDYVTEDNLFKIGKKTNLDDIYNNIFRHGHYYNILFDIVINDIKTLELFDLTDLKDMKIFRTYSSILTYLSQILSYYELKGLFYLNKNVQNISEKFIKIISELKKNILELSEITEKELCIINKKNRSDVKNYMKNTIDITNMTLNKILTKVTNKNYNITKKKESYYDKIINKIYSSNIGDIVYKYICIANDKICTDSINNMRTVKLNTFETNILHFEMDLELTSRLIYEGFSKTIKYYTNILRIMEIADKNKTTDEYIESFEMKFKKNI